MRPLLCVTLLLAGCGDGPVDHGGDLAGTVAPDLAGTPPNDLSGSPSFDLRAAPDLAPVGGTGGPCARNSDCSSSICLPLGNGSNACTIGCVLDGDCVAGWSCKALLGQPSNVCQCTP